MKILPSTVLLGASAFQISEARDKCEKNEEGQTECEDVREPKKRTLQPLGENQRVNMSLD